MSVAERKLLGLKGQQHVKKNYNFENFQKSWIKVMEDIHKTHGSWKTRRSYKAWTLKEVA